MRNEQVTGRVWGHQPRRRRRESEEAVEVERAAGSTRGRNCERRALTRVVGITVRRDDRQAVLAARKYAPDSLGVSLFSQGGATTVQQLRSWKLKSIYPTVKASRERSVR